MSQSVFKKSFKLVVFDDQTALLLPVRDLSISYLCSISFMCATQLQRIGLGLSLSQQVSAVLRAELQKWTLLQAAFMFSYVKQVSLNQ